MSNSRQGCWTVVARCLSNRASEDRSELVYKLLVERGIRTVSRNLTPGARVWLRETIVNSYTALYCSACRLVALSAWDMKLVWVLTKIFSTLSPELST